MKPKPSGGRTLRTKEILLKLYHVPDGLRRLDRLRIEHRDVYKRQWSRCLWSTPTPGISGKRTESSSPPITLGKASVPCLYATSQTSTTVSPGSGMKTASLKLPSC